VASGGTPHNQRIAVCVHTLTPSCGACRTQTPIIDTLSKSHRGVFKINVTDDINTARALGVMATPTTVLIKDEVIQNPAQRRRDLHLLGGDK
jgi:thioredoxin 1